MTHPQILIQEMSFHLPPDRVLFNQLNLTISKCKTGLVGKNGIGKSTLIKLIAGELHPLSGSIYSEGKLAYVPQTLAISTAMTVASLLGCEEKLNALHRIEQGSVDERDYFILNEDWEIEQRMHRQLSTFGLDRLNLDCPVTMLSGGEMTRLLLAGAFFSKADFLLLDEPSNHLDANAREQLYHAISEWQGGLVVVSHDRTLLNLMDEIVEISPLGVSRFGGNYDYYKEQKEFLLKAKEQQLYDAKKILQKTKRSIQLTREKHEKRQAHGQELRRRGDQPKILLDAMENRSTACQGKLLTRHGRMLKTAENKLHIAKENRESINKISVELPKTNVPNGKIILEIENLNFSYTNMHSPLISHFNLLLQGPGRIALAGSNGSGKSTLIKLILNELKPVSGKIYLGTRHIRYLDQNATLLNPSLTILENFLRLNTDANENDAYRFLAQFLFKNVTVLKLVKNLSSGEKLRALLACTLMSNQPPQLLILDEPTNHLDLDSVESIESTLANYQGAMIVISHDEDFLTSIGIKRIIYAPFNIIP